MADPLPSTALAVALILLGGCVTPTPSLTAAPAAKEASMSGPPPPNADRPPLPDLAPVVRDGVRYERVIGGEADGQMGGILAAYDAASGRELWRLKVYDNRRRDGLEGDVQDVFFTAMSFAADGRLVIEDELGRRFAVDVKARTSVALP